MATVYIGSFWLLSDFFHEPGLCRLLRVSHVMMRRTSRSPLFWSADSLSLHEAQRDAVIVFYSKCRKRGDRNVHFVDGDALIPYGVQGACSDNRAHPSNIGFQMMDEAMRPRIERIVFPTNGTGE